MTPARKHYRILGLHVTGIWTGFAGQAGTWTTYSGNVFYFDGKPLTAPRIAASVEPQ